LKSLKSRKNSASASAELQYKGTIHLKPFFKTVCRNASGKNNAGRKRGNSGNGRKNPHPDFNRLYPKKEIDDHTLNKKARS